MNAQQFIRDNHIRMSVQWADANPNMSDMPAGSSHWKCVIRAGRSQMTVFFSQGPAICTEPTAADVLDCLASDAAGIENCGGSFENWATEYGYDTDSRKAEYTYRITERQSARLRRLLGDSAYAALLWDVERL